MLRLPMHTLLTYDFYERKVEGVKYNLIKTSFPSSDGKSTVYAEIYTPLCEPYKGIVQLSHGMIDYTGRYEALAEYLTAQGYVFAGNHHLGHGATASCPEDLGFFAEKDGVELVLKDLYAMNKLLRNKYPSTPLVMLGHSMGSFLARLYAAAYPGSIKGVIIHGTGGPNPAVAPGLLLARLNARIFGKRNRSRFLDNLAFGAYNKRFPKSEGENAWLTRDVASVSDRATDPYTSFKFTASAFCDLLTMIKRSNSRSWYESYPKDMPTLVVSGDMDPVGNYGKGVSAVYKKLMIAGCNRVCMKLYPDCRHELFKEFGKEEIFAELVEWLKGAIG